MESLSITCYLKICSMSITGDCTSKKIKNWVEWMLRFSFKSYPLSCGSFAGVQGVETKSHSSGN